MSAAGEISATGETRRGERRGEPAPPGAAGDSFASGGPIGGLTTRTLKPGITRVAILTLNAAGEPSTCDLNLAGGQYLDATETRGQFPMTVSPAFEIRIESD